MKTIDLYRPTDAEYGKVCDFAQEVYTRELSHTIAHFPDLFFTITEEGHVFGCMGLNTSVRFGMFQNDIRYRRFVRNSSPNTVFAEQCTLALENCSIGLPLLVASVSEYASCIGIHRIVYASIGVSRKTIRKLGFKTVELGLVDLSTLPPEDRANCSRWFELHHPISCVLDTNNAAEINRQMLIRFAKKIRLGYALEREMQEYRDKSAIPEALYA